MTTPTSPADTLREAATLIRERANRATPGRWEINEEIATDGIYVGLEAEHLGASYDAQVIEFDSDKTQECDDAEHIASWHPSVALIIADWLDRMYVEWEFRENSLGARSVRAMSGSENHPDMFALSLARTYLGRDQ